MDTEDVTHILLCAEIVISGYLKELEVQGDECADQKFCGASARG